MQRILITAGNRPALCALVREHIVDFAHRHGALPRRAWLHVPLALGEPGTGLSRLCRWLEAQGIGYRITQGHVSGNELQLHD